MNDSELLQLIKRESKCKTNQCLLETLERLADIMRKKRAKAVYLTETKVNVGRAAEVPPEFDYIKE